MSEYIIPYDFEKSDEISIELKNLSLTYESDNSRYEALKDINLEIKKGEFICIVGQSGCGKSTLLSLLAGLNSATGGEVRINGKKVTSPGVELNRFEDKLPGELSGGMQQRVAIVRALDLVYTPYVILIMPTFKSASIFVIFLSGFWSTLMGAINNTAFVEKRIINSARVLSLSTMTILFRIIIPFNLSIF